jgi:hypothetical protein
MLSDETFFEGGHLQTYEADGALKKHTFQQGDALIFVSHKYHCVSRVTSGCRNVMVLEFWYGPERHCPHRCERFGREICFRDPGQEAHTQQHQYSEHLRSECSYVPLPFRLGSVSGSESGYKEGNFEVLELLWEPSRSDEEATATQPAHVVEKNAVLSDAFACFGSDSDDEDAHLKMEK